MAEAVGIHGLWLSNGHYEGGIHTGPGTRSVMSEIVLGGATRSADNKISRHFQKEEQ